MTKEKEIGIKKSDFRSEKLRCSKCGSYFGYIRLKDKSYVCRSCGFQDKEVII
jgi:ribosomal protein S14